MSFNIRYGTASDGENAWPNRSDLVADVIRAHDPDVLALQEALRFQLDELGAALPHYEELGVGRSDGATEGEYAAILYRADRFAVAEGGTFWLSDTPEVPGSTSWGNRVTRICTWARLRDRASGTAFYVYNVHLDHESQASRELSVELLAARIAARDSDDPVVVMGDFNAGVDNPAMLYLRGEAERASGATTAVAPSPGLRDTFRTLHPDSTGTGTFNAFRGEREGDRIDAILVSGEWLVRDAAIVRSERDGRYPSDHFPVTARLALPIP